MTPLAVAVALTLTALLCYLSYTVGWVRGWKARARIQQRSAPNVETMMAVNDAIQRMYTWKHGDRQW